MEEEFISRQILFHPDIETDDIQLVRARLAKKYENVFKRGDQVYFFDNKGFCFCIYPFGNEIKIEKNPAENFLSQVHLQTQIAKNHELIRGLIGVGNAKMHQLIREKILPAISWLPHFFTKLSLYSELRQAEKRRETISRVGAARKYFLPANSLAIRKFGK